MKWYYVYFMINDNSMKLVLNINDNSIHDPYKYNFYLLSVWHKNFVTVHR